MALTKVGYHQISSHPETMPTQTSNSGKFLSTDGTNTSWNTVDALPTQTSQSGKFLTTDGTNSSWGTVSTGVDGIVSTANATAITIDSSENVGIQVTPESHHSTWTSLQFGGTGNLTGQTSQSANKQVVIANNAYVDSTETWSHIVTDEASMYRQMGGKHTFLVAPSGTADANLVLSTALEITNDGNVSTPNRFTMSGTGSGPGLFMGGWQIFDNASESYGPANSLAFYKGGARFAVSPSGGITFNGDTAAANALDDYEEGESSTGLANITLQSGRTRLKYTKIGNMVTVHGNITVQTTGGGGYNLEISLPFTVASSNSNLYPQASGTLLTYRSAWPFEGMTALRARVGTSSADLLTSRNSTSSGWSHITSNHVTTGTEFVVSITYMTS